VAALLARSCSTLGVQEHAAGRATLVERRVHSVAFARPLSWDAAPDADSMNRLRLRYDIDDDQPTLRPVIDGNDLLAGCRNSRGLDPDRLLPPVSALLLATRGGHTALIGVCGCGQTGCGSLSVRIWRAGGEVVWEPEPRPRYETIARSYRFDLLPYLDAVDRAAGDPPAGEGRGRRAARAARVRLGLYDQSYQEHALPGVSLDWVSAWPWTGDTVQAALSTAEGQQVIEFTPNLRESEDAFAARVATDIEQLRLRLGS
jgi:hypothetical protein